jgi:hypothetical protein
VPPFKTTVNGSDDEDCAENRNDGRPRRQSERNKPETKEHSLPGLGIEKKRSKESVHRFSYSASVI